MVSYASLIKYGSCSVKGNRRVRNRTHGGVGGRGEKSPLLPDVCHLLEARIYIGKHVVAIFRSTDSSARSLIDDVVYLGSHWKFSAPETRVFDSHAMPVGIHLNYLQEYQRPLQSHHRGQ